MKNLDAWLIATVFAVWCVFAILYAVIDMIYMPPAIRVWGLGAGTFLVLAAVAWLAGAKGGRRGTGN